MKISKTQITLILHNKSTQWKLVLFLPLLCLITVAIFLITTPPATGYEYSIYTVYPLIFWILAGLLFLFPLIYLYFSHSKHTSIPFSKRSTYGLLTIAAVTLVLLLHIPKARGYLTFSSGDTLTHIGYCVDILNSGYMLTQNHYPLSHICISITSLFTGVTPQAISLSTVGVVAILFIVGIIALSHGLRFTTLQTASITAFAILPVLGYWLTIEEIMPSTIGWAFIPLFLLIAINLIFHKTNLLPYFICGVLLCAAMSLLHPEAVLFPTIMIGIILGVCILWNLTHKGSKKFTIHFIPIILLMIFFVVSFLLFFLNTNAGMDQLHKYIEIFESIISPTTTGTTPVTTIVATSDALPITEEKLSSLCRFFFNGDISLALFLSLIWRKIVFCTMIYWNLLILSALCLLTSVWYIISKKFRSLDKRYLVIIALFFIFVIISLLLLIVYPEMWGVYRIYKYPVLFGIFILGILFSDFICSANKSKIHRILSIISVIAVICMLIFSMATFYRSPNFGESNYQITNEDVEAMHLIYEYRNTDYMIDESGNQHQFRYNSYIYGMVYGEKQNKNIRGLEDESKYPPNNFGYYHHNALGQSYTKPTYYIKTPAYGEYKRWIVDELEYWPLGGRNDFGTLPESWKHLSYDSSVDKWLDGNAIEAYLIHPVQ